MAISTEGDRPMWFLVILLIQLVLATDVVTHQSDQDSVRWKVSEFRTCSAECGGGIQVRSVQCVRSEKWDEDTKDIEVPAKFCSSPPPAVTRPCNTHKCTGRWIKGDWSKCSETCGVGTQTREVTCESSMWHEKRVQIAQSQCPGIKPETSRQCYETDCPQEESSELHSILAENYTLIQLHKAKKIKVNIGGKFNSNPSCSLCATTASMNCCRSCSLSATNVTDHNPANPVNLFPGQTVIVKCPVKNYLDSLVYWSRGYRLVPFMGRVSNTNRGLVINEANPSTDAGVYTCVAGDLTATVTIGFIDKDDPVTTQYKKWIRKSKQQYNIHNQKHKNNGKDHSNVLTPSTSLGVEELTHQRDQSRNSSNVLMYVMQDWSPCNTTCQSVGYQQRNVTCSHVALKFVKMVPDSECQTAGLKKPVTIRQCNITKASCAVWRTERWSQCRPSCGHSGYKSRILTCVWQSTGEPAGRHCDLTNQPIAIKPCKPRTCPLECIDSSRYCSLTKMLKLCRYHHFKIQCCRTCEEPPDWTIPAIVV